MNDDIRAKKLIYHLTSLKNMDSILDCGLLPRSRLDGFIDVADHEIIESRKGLRLERLFRSTSLRRILSMGECSEIIPRSASH